ncbi:hypothetical protein ACKXF6_12870 [Faecalibacterium taiwanense]|uniref:hypothetical protein n=1 Tax=Faecalibacterium taiwanense TaxID=3030638 RepID=UPI003AAB9E7E
MKRKMTLGLHKVDDIVAAALDGVHVGGGWLFADRESGNRPAPAGAALPDAGGRMHTPIRHGHFLDKERVIRAVGRLVLGGQDEFGGEGNRPEWSYSEVSAPLPKQRNRA